jgi:Transposase DDE domain
MLRVRRSLPVFPDKRTISVSVGGRNTAALAQRWMSRFMARLASTNDVTRGSWIRRALDQAACPPARSMGEHSAETKSQRPICFSPYLYRALYLIERFFNKIKQCRRVATRYDKLAANYLAFIKLASIRIWLRANESTP